MKRIYISLDKKWICLIDENANLAIPMKLVGEPISNMEGEARAEEAFEEEELEDEEEVEDQEPVPVAAPKKKGGSGRWGTICAKCGKKGHKEEKCKEEPADPDAEPAEDDEFDEIRERIIELKSQGMSSKEVANELGVPVSVVNANWLKETRDTL